MDNKKAYIDFCLDNKDIPLFHKPWWLDIVTENNWEVALSFDKKGEIKASMPYSISKKYGLQIILQPVLTPYLGTLLFYPDDIVKRTSIYSFQHKHLGSLISSLPKNVIYQYFKFPPKINNWYPFYKNKYEQSTRYTYILNDIKKHDLIFNGFTNTIKRQIKQATENVEISEENNLCLVFSLVKESLERQNVKFPLNRPLLKSLEKTLEENKQGKVFVARDKNGNINSAVLIIWDDDKAYLLGLGTSLDFEKYNSTKLLIWESIKYASQFVDKFDFEGSMLPGVERLYRSFGGKQTPYFEIKKYKNQFFKILFTILNK